MHADDEMENGMDGSEPRTAPNGWSNHIIYAVDLSAEERQLRERFVTEYLYDYNAYAACLRMGMASGPAYRYSQDLIREPYVQHILALRTYKKTETAQEVDAGAAQREQDETKRQIIEALKREAFDHGPGSKQSARIAALSKLAALYGLEKDPSRDNDNTPKGGVMVIPAALTAEQWQTVASMQQKKLAEETSKDVDES